MYSVQAIVISTEVAHNLGLSDLNATLSSAAIRIAQCLGLHKIINAPNPDIKTAHQWHETLERELGKRVWWQLVIQDHFAIPFTDTYSECDIQETNAACFVTKSEKVSILLIFRRRFQ